MIQEEELEGHCKNLREMMETYIKVVTVVVERNTFWIYIAGSTARICWWIGCKVLEQEKKSNIIQKFYI